QQDTLQEIAAFARRHGIEFPILKDPGARVADLFGATRTPEAFVLDGQRVVRYRGRIDDQYGVGAARNHATQTE
ncbi:MAG TPA: redoxin domain-containing protein, partial [Lacipirellulaceae bacterium]|nr:redoxin domain-containing protein [Lacipirellulaceae bacterium]